MQVIDDILPLLLLLAIGINLAVHFYKKPEKQAKAQAILISTGITGLLYLCSVAFMYIK